MVVGVEDAARQLDQLALVAKEQQAAYAPLAGGHQQRPHPVARLEQQLAG